MGAMRLSGLTGNIALPRQNGASAASWLTENGAVSQTNLTIEQVGMTPKRLAASTAWSKQLLIQESVDVENLVRAEMARRFALAVDLAAIAGTGANNQPTGILAAVAAFYALDNSGNANSVVTFGGSMTWAKMVQFETQLGKNNADMGSIAFLTSPGVRGAAKTTTKAPNYPIFIMEAGQVNGYRLEATNQVSGDKVIFGNWNDLIIADWAGIDVVVDPYTLATNGQVAVTSQMFMDVTLRHPESFVISTDSGAQTRGAGDPTLQ